ncbi:MAG: GerMN domain-containing protein [Clostridiales bacterium]|nr:GerMN domain-containing protein [Clostridiales bacterium]
MTNLTSAKVINATSKTNTIKVEIYYFTQDEDYKHETVDLSKGNLSSDTIKFMQDINGIQINGIWYENNKICVDLNANEFRKLDAGSYAGIIQTNLLVKTFSSYPNVEEIEILIDGKQGQYGYHFNFDRVFRVSEWDNKP